MVSTPIPDVVEEVTPSPASVSTHSHTYTHTHKKTYTRIQKHTRSTYYTHTHTHKHTTHTQTQYLFTTPTLQDTPQTIFWWRTHGEPASERRVTSELVVATSVESPPTWVICLYPICFCPRPRSIGLDSPLGREPIRIQYKYSFIIRPILASGIHPYPKSYR